MGKKYNQIGYLCCWFSGVLVLGISVLIIIYLAVKGIGVINWQFLTESPQPSLNEALSGGIFSPIIGTVLLTAMGILISLPWALATAIYLSEYAEEDNHWVNTLRTGIDVLSGVPTIVFAIFGLAIFTHPALALFSTMVEGVQNAKAFGRSFFVGSITMAMMVLPFVAKSIEESIRAVPLSFKEAAFSLGISKLCTISRVVVPAAKAGIITGVILGIGRIAGDTAIVWLCLGGSMDFTGKQPWYEPGNWLATLKNTGSTLTSYIYYSSPAGEGNSPNKAFGAGLVLIILILVLNSIVDYLGRFTRLKED
ncbi:MAG TPA: phosphate ABC transporter permease PtsA [Pelotomaculum sp.]|nr:phosphate ABC transporter permease PtsA [Pelotomaculum sp.]